MPDVTTETKSIEKYKSSVSPVWCPGCGDYSVLHAMYKALGILAVEPKDAVIVSGIGCSGRFPIFTVCYGYHGAHGRLLPTATGVKLANPKLTVIGIGGDGDGLAIGGGHFPHVGRRNVDITYIMLDNSIYGLTKGQVSPTTTPEFSSRSAPYGVPDDNLNPIGLALAYNCSFVARGFSGHLNQLIDLIVQAVRHKGFSFLHVLSPCVVFNNTYPYYNSRVVEIGPDHDVTNKHKAIDLWQTQGKTYLGVFYKQERPHYMERWELIANKAKEKGAANMEKLLLQYT